MIYLDSTVLFEIAAGNPVFLPYAEQEFVIPDLTLVEFCSVMLRKYNEKTAEYWFNHFKEHTCQSDLDLLYAAMKFRSKQRGGKLSFFDAVLYAHARMKNVLLVTTDTDFRSLPGVKCIAK